MPTSSSGARWGERPMDPEQAAHFETLCAEIEPQPESVTRPLTMPIVTAAVFQVDSLETVDDLYEGRKQGYVYTRDANPNQTVLGELVARLEGADTGLAA